MKRNQYPRARWHYHGDINAEYGGFWYRLDIMQYNYADCMRISPCSDAGGPDNQFWVETLTVNIPDNETAFYDALDCCGQRDNYHEANKRAKQHIAVQCCLAFGFYDQTDTEVVQIGAKPGHCSAGFGPLTADVKLRAGSDIARYVRRAHLRNA